MSPDVVLLGKRIARAREIRGWSRSDLARRARVDPSYVTRIEEAHYKRPSVDKVAAVAAALGIRVTDLTEPDNPAEQTALRESLIAQMGLEDGPAVEALILAWPRLSAADRAANIRVIRALIPRESE